MNRNAGRALTLLISLILLIVPAHANAAQASAEQLIVFVQTNASAVDAAFQTEILPKLREMTKDMGIPITVREATDGVPKEVAITPLIVFQNARGRSIYQGRTTTIERIRSFVRTSRFIPQGTDLFVRKNTPVWRTERALIVAPVKITPLEGAMPPGHDHAAFDARARRWIEKGFSDFKTQSTVRAGRADRSFYMDFYPWLSKQGELFVNVALFSQFHCKKPVYRPERPFSGPWKSRKQIFARAAAALEEAVARQIRELADGDGFDPVSRGVALRTWSDLGLSLPKSGNNQKTKPVVRLEILPLKWTLQAPGPDDPPAVQFRFSSPLDAYFGVAGVVRAEFHMVKAKTVKGAKGYIEVDPRSISMGIKDLDKVIQQSTYLHSAKFPVARFEIDVVGTEQDVLAYGRQTFAEVAGRFTMKGTTVPMTVRAEIEPVVGADGQPRLLTRGAFRIDLETFSIEKADGPTPQNRTLLFEVNLKLKPLVQTGQDR